MTLRHNLQYCHDDELQFGVFELSYQITIVLKLLLNILTIFNYHLFQHNKFKMIILLPDAKDGLKNLETNISKIKLNGMLKK